MADHEVAADVVTALVAEAHTYIQETEEEEEELLMDMDDMSGALPN